MPEIFTEIFRNLLDGSLEAKPWDRESKTRMYSLFESWAATEQLLRWLLSLTGREQILEDRENCLSVVAWLTHGKDVTLAAHCTIDWDFQLNSYIFCCRLKNNNCRVSKNNQLIIRLGNFVETCFKTDLSDLTDKTNQCITMEVSVSVSCVWCWLENG